ncbi:MAG: LysR family transcriptional regulator [Phycisphaerales bacterium]|nr:LysR family transcriptional regulator [Phycisphaerales bacterium]
MELTALRYFKAIADEEHMTRAAERLGVTQPALSAAVRKLEEEVGAALLDRTGRGVRLTEAGRLFLEHAEASLQSADRAIVVVRELMGLERGTVSVGGGATAIGCLLPPVVRAFRSQHPQIRVRLREAGSAAVAEAVLNGALDLGFVTQPVSIPGARELMAVAELQDELVLITPTPAPGGPGTGLGSRKTFRWADIAHEPIIGFEAGSAVRRLVDDAALAHGVSLNVVMELRSIDGIQRMVAEGVGIGFVSRFAAVDHARADDPVRVLRCKDGPIARTLAVVRRRDHMPSPAVEQFERVMQGSFDRIKGS